VKKQGIGIREQGLGNRKLGVGLVENVDGSGFVIRA
jgi:hypothetical protein